MSDALSNIEDYFNGNLSATAREAFENKCISDPVFAEEVAFYVSMRDSLRQELHEQKKHEFAQLYTALKKNEVAPKSIVKRMLPYAAAACLLILIGLAFFLPKSPSLQERADNYINDNFKTLGVTMGSSADSLQMGIAAYNNKNYNDAERIFQSLSNKRDPDPEAIKNLGILYLTTKNYDKAIAHFDLLAQQKELFANPALFYKALALLKRSTGDDRETAKQILKEVHQRNLPGKERS
jgi:tetratricopeptide (TPR) repeat protein